MKVHELIKQLNYLPPKAEIVLSKDSEGNEYSPAAQADFVYYRPITSWYGELVDEEISDEDYDEGILTGKIIPAVCIWPTN